MVKWVGCRTDVYCGEAISKCLRKRNSIVYKNKSGSSWYYEKFY